MQNMIIQPDITKAVAILRAGGLVAMPTETVYGLAADAANPEAVAKVFTAKQRPASHPLIVHISDPKEMTKWAKDIPASAWQLAEHFWPGPLTLVLPRQPHVHNSITAHQETVALRMPNHPVALALLKAFASGLVAPSANRFTRISPTTSAAVREELGNDVDLILEGGACAIGLESTILDLSQKEPTILRPGMIQPESIAALLGCHVLVRRQDTPAEIRVPGMHHLHYAPCTLTELRDSASLQSSVMQGISTVCLVWSDLKLPVRSGLDCIKMPENPEQYAHDLYATLRRVDQGQYQRILIEAVPQDAKWHAIADRLHKASVVKD